MSADGNPSRVEQDGNNEVDKLRAEVEVLREIVDKLRSEISIMRSNVEGLSDFQGDENVAPGNGFVEIDRTALKHPVIRFRYDRLHDSGKEYVAGDDTNIVFTPDTSNSGKIKVDVYYK